LLKPLDAAGQALVVENLAYARNLAKRYVEKWPRERSRIFAEARYGLTCAACSYDPTAGTAFRSWAYIRINGAIADFLRDLLPRGYVRRPRDEQVPWISPIIESDPEVESATSAEHEAFGKVDDEDVLERLRDSLPEFDSEILRLVFCEDFNRGEAAERMGCHESTVSTSLRRSLRTLEAILGRRDDGNGDGAGPEA
jgi:RNA polymerase sigma factor (sigma-70 family)